MILGKTDIGSLLKANLFAAGGGFLNPDGSPGALTRTGHYRIKSDGTFQLWNPDQNLWQSVTLSGAAGAETVVISPGEA